MNLRINGRLEIIQTLGGMELNLVVIQAMDYCLLDTGVITIAILIIVSALAVNVFSKRRKRFDYCNFTV